MEKFGVETDPAAVKTAAESKEPTCPSCGKKLASGANVPVCPSCGTKPFEAPPKP